jgi:hypothetical protein
MQDWPLTVDKILEHARLQHGDREIITRRVEGNITRTTYSQLYDMSKQVSTALKDEGIGLGDRVATLGWNSERHMASWYGAMGMGAVLHTINPRLHPDQIAWIANHAEDKILIFDKTFLPIVEAIKDKLETVKTFVIYAGADTMPENKLGAIAFDIWIDGRSKSVRWGDFPEDTACGLCYTSGTTGNPKGVLYSHRSNVLHTLVTMGKDAMGMGAADSVLPVVPMFPAASAPATVSPSPVCTAAPPPMPHVSASRPPDPRKDAPALVPAVTAPRTAFVAPLVTAPRSIITSAAMLLDVAALIPAPAERPTYTTPLLTVTVASPVPTPLVSQGKPIHS